MYEEDHFKSFERAGSARWTAVHEWGICIYIHIYMYIYIYECDHYKSFERGSARWIAIYKWGIFICT
jgi:hypothetical protein